MRFFVYYLRIYLIYFVYANIANFILVARNSSNKWIPRYYNVMSLSTEIYSLGLIRLNVRCVPHMLSDTNNMFTFN